MSPVSTVPSFSTTRCGTLCVFRKATICPPKLAGFGENACSPFCPTMLMMGVVVVGCGEGDDPGFDAPPPQAAAGRSMIHTIPGTVTRMRSPFVLDGAPRPVERRIRRCGQEGYHARTD
jgi:hypothetical protein